MTKSIIVAALLSSIAVASFAQAAAPAADTTASAPAKKMKKHHAHKPATPASNPNLSTDKKGDGK